MRILKRAALLLLIPSLAHAGWETGEVRFEYGQVFSNASHPGFTFFYLDGDTRFSAPGCASYAGGERWVINNAWPAAKIQIAVLLSAKLSGKKVHAQGTGACEAWGDTETVMDVYLVD